MARNSLKYSQATESRRAAGELSSLGYQLRSMHTRLSKQVEECSTQIGKLQMFRKYSFNYIKAILLISDIAFYIFMSEEETIHQRLRNINRETHQDNQEVLQLLFSLEDDLLLQQYSSQVQKEQSFFFCILLTSFVPFLLFFLSLSFYLFKYSTLNP